MVELRVQGLVKQRIVAEKGSPKRPTRELGAHLEGRPVARACSCAPLRLIPNYGLRGRIPLAIGPYRGGVVRKAMPQDCRVARCPAPPCDKSSIRRERYRNDGVQAACRRSNLGNLDGVGWWYGSGRSRSALQVAVRAAGIRHPGDGLHHLV